MNFGDLRRMLIFLSCLLNVLWKWFLIVLSVRPFISPAIWAHLFPYFWCSWNTFFSSSSVIGSFRISGSRWLCQRSLHCFAERLFNSKFIFNHFRDYRPLLSAILFNEDDNSIIFFFMPMFALWPLSILSLISRNRCFAYLILWIIHISHFTISIFKFWVFAWWHPTPKINISSLMLAKGEAGLANPRKLIAITSLW